MQRYQRTKETDGREERKTTTEQGKKRRLMVKSPRVNIKSKEGHKK
jgi:hypothetical protein